MIDNKDKLLLAPGENPRTPCSPLLVQDEIEKFPVPWASHEAIQAQRRIGYDIGRADERGNAIAFFRGLHDGGFGRGVLGEAARMLERGDHLVKPKGGER